MPLRVAVQMDPIDQVDVSADTSILMIENARQTLVADGTAPNLANIAPK